MIWIYLIVGGVILATGVVITFAVMEGEDPADGKEAIRVIAICTAVSWLAAILWPLIVVSIVPALIIYGLWTLAKLAKHKTLDY